MPKFLDLTGQRFNNLVVVSFVGDWIDKNNYKLDKVWKCKCDCGNLKDVRGSLLRNGTTKSCGCFRKNIIKHGYFLKIHRNDKGNDRFYHIWIGMKQRCFNKNHMAYPRYGGRGITVSNEWMKFENFYDDMYTSYIQHCKEYGEKNTSLDRINNNKNYDFLNCRWATQEEQSHNTNANKFLTYNNQTKTITEWGRITGLPIQTRRYSGYGIDDIFCNIKRPKKSSKPYLEFIDYYKDKIDLLNKRTKNIIYDRFGINTDQHIHTYGEVGKKFNISGERVRQILKIALDKIVQ